MNIAILTEINVCTLNYGQELTHCFHIYGNQIKSSLSCSTCFLPDAENIQIYIQDDAA